MREWILSLICRWSLSWTFREKYFSAVVKTFVSDGERGERPTLNPKTSLWHPEQKGFYQDFFHKSQLTVVLELHVEQDKNKDKGSTVAIQYCALYTVRELVSANGMFEGWFNLSSAALKIIISYGLFNKMEGPISHFCVILISFHMIFKCVCKVQGNISWGKFENVEEMVGI